MICSSRSKRHYTCYRGGVATSHMIVLILDVDISFCKDNKGNNQINEHAMITARNGTRKHNVSMSYNKVLI